MPGILLCGSEGEQFLFGNTLSTNGSDDKRRGSVTLTAGDQMFRQFDQGYADFWLHVRVTPWEDGNALAAGVPLEIRSGNKLLTRLLTDMVVTPRLVQLQVAQTVAGTTLTSGENLPHDNFTWINYDIRVRVYQTTSPNDTLRVDLYRDEVLRTSIIRTDAAGWPLPNAVLLAPFSQLGSQDQTQYQDIIITDAIPTVGMELATLVPSAVGFYDDFTNDYTAVDDRGYDQSTTIFTTTPNDRESWFFSQPTFNLGDKVIYGVAMTTVAQTDLAGIIDDFEPFLRINSINYPQVALGANNVAPNGYTTVWTVNPSTLAPWNVAELNGLEAGLRAIG